VSLFCLIEALAVAFIYLELIIEQAPGYRQDSAAMFPPMDVLENLVAESNKWVPSTREVL
jgi:hypothetical protein